MPRKTEPYWKDIRPLWWMEIKQWFGWTDWMNATFRIAINLGGLWCALYLTDNFDDFIGSLAVELGKIIISIFLLLFILTITYIRASNKLYLKQKNKISNLSKEARGKRLWTNPRIRFNAICNLESRSIPPYINARLVVCKDEDVSLTDCFATLVSVSDYVEEEEIEVKDDRIRNNRLRWSKSAYANEKCEVEIPPTDSREINVAHTKRGLDFLLCTRDVTANFADGIHLFLVKVRVDGKYHGRSIKAQDFDGYLYYDFSNVRGSSGVIKDDGTYTPEKRYTMSIPALDFREGDWMKDEKINNKIQGRK